MNILLIHSDQHRYDCIAAHGERRLHTPHLDALAASGATFSRAYSTIPICTPARASLLTGAWPTTHGSFCIPTSELNRAARRDLPTIFTLLKAAGYRTAWVGKYHGELECAEPGGAEGVDAFLSSWRYREFRQKQGIPEEPKAHGLFGDENTTQRGGRTSLAWQADQVIRLLGDGRDGGVDSAPWIVRWDPPEPHLPCKPASEFAALYDAAAIPPWPSFPDSLEGKPGVLRRQRRIWGVEGWTWEDWAPVVRLYYGAITELDHHVGRVLAHLAATGRAEDTLVIYSTDHGDFCGGHGLMDKHFCFYEDIARIPLIVRAPGRIAPGTRCDAFASGSIDIARTVLAAAGVEAPPSFVGHDLVAMAADGARPREVAYAQYFGAEGGAYSCRMIRDARHKFVYHPTGDTHEFYDLEADPGELRNLIEEPRVAVEVARLKARLYDEMKACGDRLASRWTEIELKGAASIGEAAFGRRPRGEGSG
jgi:arylsulfatase A-like enzyme